MGLLASVVIPVLDGAATLREVLAALASQVGPASETIALDSGSTDGSQEIVRAHGARLVEVPREEFDHGLTRNLGARAASAPFVVFLSQDALPQGDDFLVRLLQPLLDDETVAGSFARQVPRADADPLTRRDLAAWVAAQMEPRVARLPSPHGLDELPPAERYRLAAFDDVAAAVRRDTLLTHPFPATRFGEDLEWGLSMLRAGFGLAYAADAVVVHSHPRRARALFRRNYLGHRLLQRLFGLRTIPDAAHLARAIPTAICSDLATLARHRAGPGLWLGAPVQATAAVLGQYAGARDEAVGRPYPRWA